MRCDELCELLPSYLGGGLEMSRRLEVVRHLAECEGCRLEAARLCRLKAELPPVPELPEGCEPFALLPEEPSAVDRLADAISLTKRSVRLGFELARI